MAVTHACVEGWRQVENGVQYVTCLTLDGSGAWVLHIAGALSMLLTVTGLLRYGLGGVAKLDDGGPPALEDEFEHPGLVHVNVGAVDQVHPPDSLHGPAPLSRPHGYWEPCSSVWGNATAQGPVMQGSARRAPEDKERSGTGGALALRGSGGRGARVFASRDGGRL